MNDHADGADLRERPIGELIKDLGRQTADLVRHEFRLATAEFEEKGKAAGAGVGLFSLGGIFGLAAFTCLTVALIALLAVWLGTPGAALLVGVAYAVVAGAFVIGGRKAFHKVRTVVPEAAVHSVKENVRWAASHMRSGRT